MYNYTFGLLNNKIRISKSKFFRFVNVNKLNIAKFTFINNA